MPLFDGNGLMRVFDLLPVFRASTGNAAEAQTNVGGSKAKARSLTSGAGGMFGNTKRPANT
jgi:hypothetical protein